MPYKHQPDAFEHVENAPCHTDFNHVKYKDLHEKPADHETGHLMSAMGELKAGEPVPSYFPGPTVAYVIEGEIEGEDRSKPGETFTVKQGDVIHLEGDTHITWKTASNAKMVGVTYVPTSYQSVADLIVSN